MYTLCMCMQTQLWLALYLITRYSQLLITWHLFCPRSALFCAYYQPGRGQRIRGRALPDTLLLKFSSQLFSPWLPVAEDTSACISESKEPANKRTFESLLTPLISLLGLSLFTQPDDIMTIKRGSVPFHFLSGGWLVCVL